MNKFALLQTIQKWKTQQAKEKLVMFNWPVTTFVVLSPLKCSCGQQGELINMTQACHCDQLTFHIS